MTNSSVSSGLVRRAPDNAKSSITPELVYNVLRRWWTIVVPAGLVAGAAAAAIIALSFRPHYDAKVLVRMAEQTPYLVESRSFSSAAFAENQIGLARSTLVLGPAVSRPEVLAALPKSGSGEDAISVLRQAVNVTRAWGSEHFYITGSSETPGNAVTIANSVAESYMSLAGEYEAGRDKRLIELLDEEKEVTHRTVEQLRENVRQMTIEQTGKDPFGQKSEAETASFPLANIQAQLTAMKVEETVLRAQIKALEEFAEKNPSGVSDAMVDRAVEQNEQFRDLQAQLKAKRDLALEIKSKSVEGEKSPRYMELVSQTQDDEAEFAKVKERFRVSARDYLASEASKKQLEKLDELKTRLADSMTRTAVLTKAYEDEVAKIKSFTGATLALEVKRGELQRADAVLDRISQRAFMLRTEQRAPARVEVLEKATMPSQPVENVPYKKLLMAFGVAFVAPFGLAILWDLRIRRVTTSEQLQDRGSMPVVGEISNLPINVGQNRYFGKQRANRQVRLFEESVESLRICLLMTKSLCDAQVLAICSAASQEGKTTLSTQLAISVARTADGMTLLIDGDMRAPDIHAIFEVENKVGLAEVLMNECEVEDAIVPSWDSRLHLLPGGKLRMRPHELVKGGSFGNLIAELRKKYRYIIIDTPPVLPAGESLVMAAVADATLVCVRRDHSREDQIRKTHERLVTSGANVVGCVFSGLPLSHYKYRYGGYYYGENRR